MMGYYNTESNFGLEEIDGKITADSGKTFLKNYYDMSSNEFNELVADIEAWKEKELNHEEMADLIEILSCAK